MLTFVLFQFGPAGHEISPPPISFVPPPPPPPPPPPLHSPPPPAPAPPAHVLSPSLSSPAEAFDKQIRARSAAVFKQAEVDRICRRSSPAIWPGRAMEAVRRGSPSGSATCLGRGPWVSSSSRWVAYIFLGAVSYRNEGVHLWQCVQDDTAALHGRGAKAGRAGRPGGARECERRRKDGSVITLFSPRKPGGIVANVEFCAIIDVTVLDPEHTEAHDALLQVMQNTRPLLPPLAHSQLLQDVWARQTRERGLAAARSSASSTRHFWSTRRRLGTSHLDSSRQPFNYLYPNRALSPWRVERQSALLQHIVEWERRITSPDHHGNSPQFVDVDEMIVATGDGLAERKRLLVEGCDCIIALPGGAGTFDELQVPNPPPTPLASQRADSSQTGRALP
jgi:hypothetical protein